MPSDMGNAQTQKHACVSTDSSNIQMGPHHREGGGAYGPESYDL